MSAEDTYVGRRISDGAAKLIYDEMARIREELGHITSTDVSEELVRRARSKTSPIHHLFEWDGEKAAHEHRLTQARGYIRAVYVVFKELPEQPPVRAILNVVADGKRGPMPTRRVLQSADLTQQVLEKALEDLETWRRRYETLQALAELRDVFEVVKRALKRTRDARKSAHP